MTDFGLNDPALHVEETDLGALAASILRGEGERSAFANVRTRLAEMGRAGRVCFAALSRSSLCDPGLRADQQQLGVTQLAKPQSIAIVFPVFSDYHIEQLNRVVMNGANRAICIEITGGRGIASGSVTRVEGQLNVPLIQLFKSEDYRSISTRELVKRLHLALDAARPNAVAVPAWSTRSSLAALRWCLEHGVPCITLSDSTFTDKPRFSIFEWGKRILLSNFAAAVVAGKRSRRYLESLGINSGRIFEGCDVINNAHFATHTYAKRMDSQSADAATRFGNGYCLVCCRLVAVKNLSYLLLEYAKYLASSRRKMPLVIVGDGPLREKLEALAARACPGMVTFAGKKSYNELPDYYLSAKALILASRSETWGLVVNEAMAAGLPVIVSRRCGCADDLVTDEDNGWTFDPDCPTALTNVLLKLDCLPNERVARMGERSRARISAWDLDKFDRALNQALICVCQDTSSTVGVMQRVALGAAFSAASVLRM